MKARANNSRTWLWLSTIILSAALLLSALTFIFTSAKYVTEIGGDNDLEYETQMPADIKTQQDLYNAVTSGYEYVKLSEELDGSLIMTGEELSLRNDLVIDLNGKEITRNDRRSLLNIPSGKTLTVIDTGKQEDGDSDGGLYNPIGSVLTVAGGKLTVYGGKFESGPRPSEYYTDYKKTHNALALEKVSVQKSADSTAEGALVDMPIYPLEKKSNNLGLVTSGGMYFDADYENAAKFPVLRDTYFYVATSEGTKNEFESLDVRNSSYSYKYRVNSDGAYYSAADEDLNSLDDDKKAELETTREVLIMAYENDVAMSMEESDGKAVNNFAAVQMFGGTLDVDVKTEIKTADGSKAAPTGAGSFYSYFGTWHTYCIFMNGGIMNVATSGEFATVDPSVLPPLTGEETRFNSTKYGESACIMCADGTLNITEVNSVRSFNGSAISVSGGTVSISDTSITKTATLSHSDDPFFADPKGEDGAPSEFPAARQYRDAALFMNGGTLELTNVDVKVNKTISTKYPQETDGSGNLMPRAQTTFGILSRGRAATTGDGGLRGENLNFDLQGPHSYGIYATRGKISLKGGIIDIKSEVASYGVYALNKSSENPAQIELDAYTVNLGGTRKAADNTFVGKTYYGEFPSEMPQSHNEWISLQGGGKMRVASVGVYLDSSEFENGNVTFNNGSVINSQEIGVAVDGGKLAFNGGGEINAYNSSAISLRGGNIYFDTVDTAEETPILNEYKIFSAINAKQKAPSQCKITTDTVADNAGTHMYEIYLPWQVKDTKTAEQDVKVNGGYVDNEYENTNGVRVIGGSLEASDESQLNVDFTGLLNDYDMYNTSSVGDMVYFDNVVIKSFAITCSQEGEDLSKISVRKANIVSKIGGGVKVAGGEINLGTENVTQESDIKVETLGNQHYRTRVHVSKNTETAFETWDFYPNLGGGHAVVAREGTVNVYNGLYTAEYGNGIAATGNDAKVNVFGGTFIGKLEHSGSTNKDSSGNRIWGDCYNVEKWGSRKINQVGPGSHYGVMVMGNATVNIKGGTFMGENGGLFVRGKDDVSVAALNIEKGKFGAPEKDNAYGYKIVPQDCVVVAEYSSVNIGTLTRSDLTGKSNAEISAFINITGANSNISVNDIIKTGNRNVKVRIYYGNYNVTATSGNFGLGVIDTSMPNVDFRIVNDGTRVTGSALSGFKIKYERPGVDLPYPTTTVGVCSDADVFFGETLPEAVPWT